jgi:hypothetical protein
MLKKNTISLFLVFLVLVLFCTTKPHNNCQIISHNIQLFINPETNSLTAIDSIGISYKENTDHIYFLLHDSLDLEKIEVGHLVFEFSKIESKNNKTHKAIGCENIKDVTLYKVKIPFNLSPNSMRIFYSGYIWEPNDKVNLDQFDNFLLTNERVVLKKDSCWYPTIPNNQSSFSVLTLAPKKLLLRCKAEHELQQIDGDFIMNRWTYAEPVDGISILSIDG